MKFRLFPTEEEEENLKKCLKQFRWYYNANVDIVYKRGDKEKLIESKELSYNKVRDLVRKYRYHETVVEEPNGTQRVTREFIHDPERNEIPMPQWMEGVHSRIPRGASKKFTQNINSCISNVRNGNYRNFNMHFSSEKDPTEFMLFEDASYPSWINNIKSHYWYRTKNYKRTTVSYNDIRNVEPGGFEILHDRIKNRYFLHYPVGIEFFPEDSIRNEKQDMYTTQKERIISLDPGVRKFLVGYNPNGIIVEVGCARNRIIELLLQVDNAPKNLQSSIWNRIKGLIEDLHKKTAAYLVANYDIILLPDFRVQGMIKKRNLGKMTKRIMTMLSFYKFRTYLAFKCKQYSKKLIIVDESYTSKTCTKCGVLGTWGSKETIECQCGLRIDRDIAGSRNIFLKNMKLL
jgi:IS605 OrfB family transposase